MRERPYSLRDLRSIFHSDTLVKDFFGDYDYASRRWRFGSPGACKQARAFLSERKIYSLHIPGATTDELDAIHRYGGFSVVQAGEDDGRRFNRRGTAYYVFKSDDARMDAMQALYSRHAASAASLRELERALVSAPDDIFPDGTPNEIRERISLVRPWQHEVNRWLARIEAAAASRPPNDTADRVSREDAIQHAKAFAGDFTCTGVVREGTVQGMVVGRGAHHVAIRTDDEHNGVLVERWRVATPLRLQDSRERNFERGAPIDIRFTDHGATALQIRGEDDREYGCLVLEAHRAAEARDMLPIIQSEDIGPDDVDGIAVGVTDHLAAILDDGAYITMAPRHRIGEHTLNSHVQLGPSYDTTISRSYARAR